VVVPSPYILYEPSGYTTVLGSVVVLAQPLSATASIDTSIRDIAKALIWRMREILLHRRAAFFVPTVCSVFP
jgi:hypothetical protein